MFDMLIKQMLPPGFDLEKTISQVQQAIQTTVATVQRIEAKQDAIIARLDAQDAYRKAQGATVQPLLTQGNDNDDRQQHDPAGNDYDAPGASPAGPGGNGDGGRAYDHGGYTDI